MLFKRNGKLITASNKSEAITKVTASNDIIDVLNATNNSYSFEMLLCGSYLKYNDNFSDAVKAISKYYDRIDVVKKSKQYKSLCSNLKIFEKSIKVEAKFEQLDDEFYLDIFVNFSNKPKVSAKEMLNKCYKQFWNLYVYVKKLQIDLLKKDFAKMIDDADSETYM